MSSYFTLSIQEEVLYLLSQKAIYRPAKNQLILSDLHLGKTLHFRKKGIALPALGQLKDIDALHALLRLWKPESVLILGDLFHSAYNREWLLFKSLLLMHPEVGFTLVKGNHDILDEKEYQLENLVITELAEDEHFIFSHHPLEGNLKINMCGHLHPGFRIFGKARQAERLPCFYLAKNRLVLPAFGDLTGMHVLEKEEDAQYYLVTGTRVIAY